MNIKDKYCFDFNWFINTYNKINYPDNCLKFNKETINFINSIYDIHYINYDGFLDEVLPFLKQIHKKTEYLKSERKCIKCNYFYPYTLDIHMFIMFKQDNLITDITNDLCYDCIRNLKYLKCKKCSNNNLEPYSQIYLDNLHTNFICSQCYPD
jgi:hypothetical protein